MKIVYFFPTLKDAAGTERVLNIKANYLADILNYDVTIITYKQFDDPIFFDFSDKIKFIHLNIEDPTPHLRGKGYWEKRKQYKNFMKTYRQKAEEYLHNNPTDIAVSLYIGAEFKFLSLINDGSKKILEFHFPFKVTSFSKILKEPWQLGNLKRKIQTKLFQRTLNKFDKIVCETREDSDDWAVYFHNTMDIPNPITITPVTADPTIKKVLAVGRFTEQKGFDYLIDAWSLVSKKFPDWSLNIYGWGDLEDQLRAQIKRLNLENSITLHPPTKDLRNVYASHSIYTLSSRFEGSPLVLSESIASGLAPVAFECKNGPKQMLGDSRLKDFLVTPFSVEEFAEKLITLMQGGELRKEMAQEALKVSKRYEIGKIMEQWEDLFKSL